MTAFFRREWLRQLVPCLGLLAGFIYLIFSLNAELRGAARYLGQPIYPRVEDWISSAECSQKTHTFLVLCQKDEAGNYIPIENASYGDDRAHALIGNILSWITSEKVGLLTYIKVNFFLNAFGIFSLALSLFFSDRKLASLAALFFGAQFGINHEYASADVTAAHIGIASLALTPIVWWSHWAKLGTLPRRWFWGSLLPGLSLTFAVLLREPVGRAAELGCLFIAACVLWKFIHMAAGESRAQSKKILFALFLSVFFAHFGTWIILSARNLLYPVAPSSHSISHGIAHNLYMGLGYLPNSFGIKNEDEFAMEAAKKEEPDSNYLTDLHFKVMWRLYFRAVSENPREVLRIYTQKTKKIFKLYFFRDFLLWKAFAVAFLLSAAAFLLVRPSPWMEFLPIYLYLALYYLQGVLATPVEVFLYGGKTIVVLIIILSVNRIFSWIRNSYPDGFLRS
ncbi:MAG: hypothetical protein AB7K68_04580 [Bacteriovoracia bacterium]